MGQPRAIAHGAELPEMPVCIGLSGFPHPHLRGNLCRVDSERSDFRGCHQLHLEHPTQINKDISRTNLPKKEKSNTDLSITHSIPIHSGRLEQTPIPLPYGEDETAQPQERKRTERNDAYRVYEEIIKDNIEYDILLQDMKFDHDRLNEIVDIILETLCTSRKKIRIAGDDYPAELVKSKFMKLNSEHIRFVLDCMQENTTKIRNIKQYLKAVLFNSPSYILLFPFLVGYVYILPTMH